MPSRTRGGAARQQAFELATQTTGQRRDALLAEAEGIIIDALGRYQHGRVRHLGDTAMHAPDPIAEAAERYADTPTDDGIPPAWRDYDPTMEAA